MASAFDEERKKLGINTYSNTQSSTSAFDTDRMDLGLIPDTRPKAENSKKEQPKTQAEARLFGNDAIRQFGDKLPAASLLTAGTGGPKDASNLLPANPTEYDIQEQRIDKSKMPTVIKNSAHVLNYLGRGNAGGRFVTNLFPYDPQAVQRDSTGNKTLDKIDDFAATYLTPATIPTGAPFGQGIIGSTYGATEKVMNTGIGNKVTNYAADALINKGLIPKASASIANNIAKVGITEGIAGAGQGVGFGLQQGQDSAEEIKRNALMGAVAGGVLGGAGSAVGEGITSALSKIMKRSGRADNEVAATLEEVFTPRQPEIVPQNEIRTNLPETNPIALQQSPELLALPQGRNTSTMARISKQTNVYRQKFENLIAEAQKRTLSPGREDIELENLWSQMADRTDPSLNELIDLAYPKRTNVPQKGMVSAARANQEMREVAGVGNPVKSSAPQVFADAAPPKQILGRSGTIGTAKEGKIRNPQTITREQEIYNKAASGQPLTQEEIDFAMSDSFNKENLLPESTPTESTYVKPVPKTVETMQTVKSVSVPEIPKQSSKIVNTNVPVTVAPKPVTSERGFTQTLKASDKTPEALKSKLSSQYKSTTNKAAVDKANARLAKDVDDATSMVLGTKKFDPEKSATAQRLIDHYNKQGNYEMSVTIADKIATEATKAGQFIQSLSIYNRLTPEGVLIHAKRIANRVNETSSKLGKQAEVTPKMAEDIVSLAGVTQKMTGVKDLSNNVIDILEKAKSGEKLTSIEADTLNRFVNESKQFIKETTKPQKPPKAPTAPKDTRVRDNVASFLDAQEKAAKERLKAKGIRISSTPLDIWADYAVIGAAKMGKGVIKFADWSEQMVKDLGEDIRPQLAQLYDSSKEAFNLTSKKISRETISDAERLAQKVIKEKQLTGEEAESLLNIAQRVSALSGEAKRTASQDLQAILQSLDKPSLGRKIASAQTQAQLLNPKTQVRNVLGNELFYRLERINKYVSTPIDIARSKLTGTNRTVTFRTFNQGKYWDNWIKGGSAGARGVNINGLETQFDLASPAFTGKYNPLRYTEKALGASLRSFDNAAYSRAVNKSLGEMATLDAINKGVKPTKEYVKNFIAKADENVAQLADNYGRYVTFQDNNLISQGLTKFKRGLNLGKDFGFGDLVLKYPKTPGALLARALEYSPAGFIRSGWQIARPIFKNGVEKDPAAVVQGLSRAIIGTFGLSGMGIYLIKNDILTGQANKDRDIRSLQSAAGQGQYQVNLSALERFVKSGFDPEEGKIKEGDLLYNYDWMQPVSVAISMGANIQKNLSSDAPKGKVATGALGAAYDSFAGGLNTLTEQSVLQGLARAAEGYPGQTVTDKIADVLSDVPSSFIPTIFNQVKQITDNTKRETTDPTLLEQTLNKAQAKIPGLAGRLPKKYDSLGNEQKHYQNNSVANVFLNPGFPSRYKLSDEARMIVDLIAETGDEGIAPRVPNKKLDGTPLTGEEFSRLSQLQGEFTKNSLGKVKETLSDKSKIKSIKKKLTKSGEKARKELLSEYPRLQAKP